MALIVHYHTAVPASKRTTDAKSGKTKDCGCGGHDKKTTDAALSCESCGKQFEGPRAGTKCPKCGSDDTLLKVTTGKGMDTQYAQKLTRDAGEPVNAAWLKLDRMTPDSLAREARSKGIKDETKTGQVMGILRATFKPVQIDAWSQHF